MTQQTASDEALRVAAQCLLRERKRGHMKTLVIIFLIFLNLLCWLCIGFLQKSRIPSEQKELHYGEGDCTPRVEDTVSPSS